VHPTELMLFSRQMYALLKAGVPIMRALGGLQESTDNPALRAALKGVRESLDGGRDLSQSMARQKGVFSPFYVSMVYVGESTGRLEEVFLRLFHHLEFQEFMRAQVKSAIRYPSFVVAAMAIAIVIINVFVVPAFAKVYRGFGADLPMVTRWLIGFSDFTVAAWPWIVGGLVVGLVVFGQWTRTAAGRLAWDRAKLRIPVAGKIILKATIARFSRSFSLAVRSGVPIVQGLTLTAQTVDNAHVARQVEKMREGVERGESVLRTAMHAGVFTPVALQMIVVGEESGALDDMLQEVADLYQREVEYELKTLASQIEPILIVALGILVLILALGVFLPIWDLGSAAMKK
jgi:MSHA biogenesis protein MshG